MYKRQIQINELSIPIKRSNRRKSVGISVNRDGSVSVAAPKECERAKIDEYVQSKAVWIYQKLAQRELITSEEVPPKQFVDGSSFWFLGKTYRLLVCNKMPKQAEGKPLCLDRDRFLIHQESVSDARECFRRWYVDAGRPIIDRIVEQLGNRISTPTKIDLRDIGFRWGSCTTEGKILISWRSIQLPMDALEYVVAHEMVHLLHRKHDSDFWHQLHKVMPDYVSRKEWLASNGEKFAAEF